MVSWSRLFALVFITAALLCECIAQDVQVSARVDSNNILIGDWVKLHLEARHQEGAKVQFPVIADSLQGMEIVKRDSLVTQKVNQQVLESITYTLTAFDSGTFVIPPFTFRYTAGGPPEQTAQTAESAPIPIFVHGMGVDTSKDIKDIKPPVSLSITLADLLPYIIGVVVLGGIIWLVYYIVRKRKRGEPLLPQEPPRPEHEVAVEALRALESEKFWQRGLVKEYHSQLTDITRMYIERRYGVMALEMITEEILSSSSIKGLDSSVKIELREMLVLADLVKFAKLQPTPEENDRSIRQAFSFVDSTKRGTIQREVHAAPQEVVS